MTPLIVPSPTPTSGPRSGGAGPASAGSGAAFVPVEGESPSAGVRPAAAPTALAAMAAMGGMPGVAARMRARQLARRYLDGEDVTIDEEIVAPPRLTTPAPETPPQAAVPVMLPRARGGRVGAGGLGAVTAFLAQQFAQEAGGRGARLPITRMIAAYLSRLALQNEPRRGSTLTHS